MKLNRPAILKLAEMICGNLEFDYFPYRSSSQLTKFFIDLDLDYVHDGGTRHIWVQDVLNQLNDKESSDDNFPNRDLTRVIESLINPDYFLFDDKVDHTKAVQAVKATIKSSKLTLKELSDGQYLVALLNGEFISTAINQADVIKHITFSPTVFTIPEKQVNQNLVSIMMPFNAAFHGTYDAIKKTCDYMELECLRADDIWQNTTFIQDIFELIYTSNIIVVDFSTRNPNVMYETGIAHTLGKTVIPIAQSINDVPSDLTHHRALVYLPNHEGYRKLSNDLWARLCTILGREKKVNKPSK
jgi:hypothetical protein